MIVQVSGFGKGDPSLESDLEMANGNMADGKCVPASEDVVEAKAPEKTGALQKLRRFGCGIRDSAILLGGELQMNSGRPGKPITNSEAVKKSKALLSPALLQRRRGEESL